VINLADYFEQRQFLEDAGCVVLERVRDVIERYNGVKDIVSNSISNSEFVADDKYANKSIKSTRNYEIFQTSNLHEWYKRHIIEPKLVLEEFQECDSV